MREAQRRWLRKTACLSRCLRMMREENSFLIYFQPLQQLRTSSSHQRERAKGIMRVIGAFEPCHSLIDSSRLDSELSDQSPSTVHVYNSEDAAKLFTKARDAEEDKDIRWRKSLLRCPFYLSIILFAFFFLMCCRTDTRTVQRIYVFNSS